MTGAPGPIPAPDESSPAGSLAASGARDADAPMLSVVVVNWNGADYLPACLASVIGDGREILVVDNGSTDGSRERLGDLADAVHWIDAGANLGFSRAANRGLRAATGRLVLFLNPDAVANEAALAEAARLLDQDPATGLVSVAVVDEQGRRVPTVEPFLSLRSLATGRWESRVSAPEGPDPVRIPWCHGAFLMGRREEILALGGFDEKFFLYAEDMDLCRRVQESGKAVVYSPRVSIFHRGNAAGETLLGPDRPAAILASQLLDHRARHGSAATAVLRGAAVGFHGLRWAVDSLRGEASADLHRALARVALRGPSAGPLADASRRAAEAAARIEADQASRRAASPVAPSAREDRGAVTIAVLARADEPALGATLRSLERAAGALAARGHATQFAICVNGADGRLAAADARAFAECMRSVRTSVIREPRADKARAWNLVRSACTTPFLVFCDADVEVAPDALVRLVEALEQDPGAALASARQVPRLDGATLVARAAALPYRFDFGVVGGRLYALRASELERMPEGLLLEDGWLSARFGRARLLTVADAEVRFRPPATAADYFRERLRTEAGKVQIREERRAQGGQGEPIAAYPWSEMRRRLGPADWPLVAFNLGVRACARVAAEVASRAGRDVRWSTVTSSKPPRAAGGES